MFNLELINLTQNKFMVDYKEVISFFFYLIILITKNDGKDNLEILYKKLITKDKWYETKKFQLITRYIS